MSDVTRYGWASRLCDDGITPVVWPLNDLREHDIDSVDCWCEPFWDEHILVHNSADQRETYEYGKKTS